MGLRLYRSQRYFSSTLELSGGKQRRARGRASAFVVQKHKPGALAKSEGELRFIQPMLAGTGQELPREGKWSLEVKLDGIRAIAIKDGADTRLYSRRPREVSVDYPDIVHAISLLPVQKLMVDGEIVALDDKGRSSFQLLQNAKRNPAIHARIFYVMFDLMHVDGRDTTSLPLTQRRQMLRGLAPTGGPLKFSASLGGSFRRVWKLVQKLGLEGIIAKREDSKYESGRRSGAWVKIKTRTEQEFVIGGYTPPEGHRQVLWLHSRGLL